MNDYNDPHNIMGMASILADDEEGIDIDKIEKSITQGINFNKTVETPIDLAKEFGRDVEQLSRQFGVTDTGNAPILEDDEDITNLLNWQHNEKERRPSQYQSGEKSSGSSRGLYTVDENDGDDEDEEDEDEQIKPDPYTSHEQTGIHHSWSAKRPDDKQLNRMTNEERKQTHINDVLGTMDGNENDETFIEQEDEEDEMARVMEQIDLLRTNLESEGVVLSRIPEVDSSTSRKEAKGVLKILQIKNDRLRYCDMFEEAVLACAYGLESVFDGKKEIFGTKIDLVGYPETVKVKLRRMRYDTSSFVSGVVKGYSIGHGWRIIFELLPSLFLYSRDRRLRTSDNLVSDNDYKSAINNLNN
jgi:hypothetical protein